MDLSAWAFYLLLALAALAAVILHYRLREPAGRGRGLLVGLRWLALALVLLLLFDPVVPAAGGTGSRTVTLVDASLSMRLPDTAGVTRWEAARVAAESAPGGVLYFGGPEAVSAAEVGDAEPAATSSRLEPAVRAAAEAGASRIMVVTDGALEDVAAARALASRAGVAVETRRVGTSAAWNAGLVEVEAPSWLEVGEEAEIRAAVGSVGAGGDSVIVSLRRAGPDVGSGGGDELARARIELPPEGRLAPVSLRFTPLEGAAGPVRLDVALEGPDAESDDDVRSVYVRIADEPAGVALLSLRPDQEPRFLLPVLERALGVPVRGWLALPGDRYVRLGTGAAAGALVDQSTVRRAVERADAVVLHGVDDAAAEWERSVLETASRLLVFPVTSSTASLDDVEGELPFSPGPVRPGDWYPDGDVPSSPVAPLIAGVEPGEAPPLVALRTPEAPEGFWSPLNARLARRGEALPVVLAGRTGGRRVAVALGSGYWRWAFADGTGRDVYDRLWSAIGAWLMEEDGGLARADIEPVERVVARGADVRFAAPGEVDSVHVRLVRGAGDGSAEAATVDSVLAVSEGAAVLGTIPPGHYRYEVRAMDDGSGESEGAAGELTVESYSREFTRPVARALDVADGAGGEAGGDPAENATDASSRDRPRDGRPLRASAWPYVLLVLILCVEWALRRRWGLR